MKYQLFIALRYLRAKHKQAFTSVITVISILGVAIGVMALVVALSLMTGMHDQIRANILGTRAHISMYAGSSQRTIEHFADIREQVLGVEGVVGASPLVREYGMVMGPLGQQGTVVHGVKPGESFGVIEVFDHVSEGDWRGMQEEHGEFRRKGMVIGYALAEDLGVRVGDSVQIYTISTGNMSPMGYMPTSMKLQVVGIFESGDWMADSSFCYVPMDYMQKVLKLGEGITMMQVKTDDIFGVAAVKGRLQEELGDYYLFATWIEENSMFFEALQLEKLAMFLTITLIVTVASLNIISTLIMLVMEKNRDIGVLRSMGASSGGIMSTFMLQGLIIGVLGTLFGALFGAGLSAALDYYEVIKLPGEVYTITSVQFKIVPLDIFFVCGIALLISLLATIYPAWKASRLQPAEALRYE